MSDISPKRVSLPYLDDDLVWMIFVRADPKTVGRARCCNKKWNGKLSAPFFVRQNFMYNKNKNKSALIGVGHPPVDDNSRWFIRADVESGLQLDFNIPIAINNFGFYCLVGSDHGNVCIRFSQGGMNSSLLIWNPLTRQRIFVFDEARRHCCHVVSLYAFGYLANHIEYRIVHVYKRHYTDRNLLWSLYNSFEADWNHYGVYTSNVQKLGPKSVVNEGVVYWIGWRGVDNVEPISIVTFNLQKRVFSEALVPDGVRSTYHAITHFNDSVGFISQKNVGFSRHIIIWQLIRHGHDELEWAKMLQISGIGIPYNPSLFDDRDIISVIDAKSNYGGANDAEITDILISKFRYKTARREHLIHRTWHENVYVKSVTMHLQGLYPV